MLRLLLVFAITFLAGCARPDHGVQEPKPEDQRKLIGDWTLNDWSRATFFEDGTFTVEGFNGHSSWKIESGELVWHSGSFGTFSSKEARGLLVWRDENHVDIVDMNYKNWTGDSYKPVGQRLRDMTPEQLYARPERVADETRLVRICEATRHGTRYY